MHVLLLADAAFAEHERALLERTAAGLTGEGIRVSLAIPKRTSADLSLVVEPIRYSDRGLIFTQRIRAEQVAQAIDPVRGPGKGVIDVVHAFGGGAWAMGKALADLYECPLAIEIWRGGLVDRVRSMRQDEGATVACFAPDRPIERALASEEGAPTSRLTPWGALAPPRPTPILRGERAPSIVFLSSGRDEDICRAAFTGVCSLISETEDAMLFVAAESVRRAGLWKLADRAGVLDRLTLLDRLEDRRELVLCSDVVIYPDARHEQRTILLDAMASGLVIVAASDPLVSAIIPGITAVVPEQTTSNAWHDALKGVLADRDGSIALGLSAREHIRQARRASAHIAALVDAYHWLAGSDAIVIAPPAPSPR